MSSETNQSSSDKTLPPLSELDSNPSSPIEMGGQPSVDMKLPVLSPDASDSSHEMVSQSNSETEQVPSVVLPDIEVRKPDVQEVIFEGDENEEKEEDQQEQDVMNDDIHLPTLHPELVNYIPGQFSFRLTTDISRGLAAHMKRMKQKLERQQEGRRRTESINNSIRAFDTVLEKQKVAERRLVYSNRAAGVTISARSLHRGELEVNSELPNQQTLTVSLQVQSLFSSTYCCATCILYTLNFRK